LHRAHHCPCAAAYCLRACAAAHTQAAALSQAGEAELRQQRQERRAAAAERQRAVDAAWDG